MTKQRINEIKRRTVGKAIFEIKKIDFEDSTSACFKVGMLPGELSNNLEHELYKEMVFRNRENKKIFNDSQKGKKTNER